MFTSPIGELQHLLISNYIVQLTGGQQSEYDAVAKQGGWSPLITIDCNPISSLSEFQNATATALGSSVDDDSGGSPLKRFFGGSNGGTVYLRQYDTLTDDVIGQVTRSLIGMWETANYSGAQNTGIIATVDDESRITTKTNIDRLQGRIETVDLSNYR